MEAGGSREEQETPARAVHSADGAKSPDKWGGGGAGMQGPRGPGARIVQATLRSPVLNCGH